jgi:hypothetical protein
MASTVTGHPRVALRRWISASARKTVGISLLTMALGGCRQSPREPVTLSYFRLGWSQPDELPTANPLERQFTLKTSIRLKNLPVPETTLDQLDLSRKLLEPVNCAFLYATMAAESTFRYCNPAVMGTGGCRACVSEQRESARNSKSSVSPEPERR